MAIPISNVTRRVVYEADGTGPYAFTFEILANTDIAVYKDDALLTLTTDYTVTIASNGTGSITLVAAPTGADQIAIVGNRTIQRTTDFVTGGDFFANTVNNEMDQQTIFAQQNAEALQRALIAPQTDPTTIDMTLPRASVRANKTLAFDSNGDPTTGEVIGDNRGNWATGTAYNKRDIVKDTSNGDVYYCNTSHTSSGSQPISTNADSAKWDLFVDNASAAAAQAAAEAAQAAAEQAETNAETAETNAETAATAAASSASAASTSASSASTSASNASSSATTASTAATNAGNSATSASTSATNASNSASAASTSASNASSSASAASTSASNASTSATNAASSASSASTSASTAGTQATNAAASATAAAGSATNASNSASAAATSATNAATSETNAAASAAAAASALDSFDDRYLGSKTSDPTVDNDGNALVTGALYYNSTVQAMKVYDGASWITATAAGTSAMSRYRYVATSGQTTFSGSDANSLTLSYTSGNIVVARNGAMLDPSEYTASNGTSVVLGVAAGTGDVVDIVAFKSFTVADTYSIAGADAEFLRKANEDGVLIASGTPANTLVTTTGGNVGIGTASPYAPNGKNLNLNDAGGTIARLTLSVSGAKSYSVNSTSDSALTVYDNTAGTERVRIDTSGRLLVGTTNAIAKLCVQENSTDMIALTTTGTNTGYLYNSSSTGTSSAAFFIKNGNGVGSISCSTSATAYNTSSDYRLKNTIAPMTGALAKVALLKPCTYKWNVDGSDGQGFIAHELAEVEPGCVTGEKDAVDAEGNPQYQGIDTSFLVATLTAAIQEQQAIITALTARVEALEGTQP
jgi:hypothetical protein